uniref:Uncharacterized protein n=1 Tax=Trypanosoma congolense (strain IL3000) TaxID=1068625 RepID=G0UQP1_TRYCI|nr:hypothetical protein, unlikely [Trypanosoma congolense IL3000]
MFDTRIHTHIYIYIYIYMPLTENGVSMAKFKWPSFNIIRSSPTPHLHHCFFFFFFLEHLFPRCTTDAYFHVLFSAVFHCFPHLVQCLRPFRWLLFEHKFDFCVGTFFFFFGNDVTVDNVMFLPIAILSPSIACLYVLPQPLLH